MITKIFILIAGVFLFLIVNIICVAIRQGDEECDSGKYWEEHELDDGVDH